MGVAVGDYDGDGLPDLYVTQYPNSILYHNNGDGTFTDVTAKAGVACRDWGTSAVWFDYDNDGRLDLFVCQFADFSKSKNVYCGDGDRRALLLQAQRVQAHRQLALPQQRRRHLHRCQPRVRHRRALGKSLGSRRRRHR